MQSIQSHIVIIQKELPKFAGGGIEELICNLYVLQSHDKTTHFLLEHEEQKVKRQFISQAKAEELIKFSEDRALGMINDKIEF